MGRSPRQSNSGLASRFAAEVDIAGTLRKCHLFKSHRPKVTGLLLWMQAVCQLFTFFHLPSAAELPSIRNESWPAGLVMAVTDF